MMNIFYGYRVICNGKREVLPHKQNNGKIGFGKVKIENNLKDAQQMNGLGKLMKNDN